jgi:tetratricopeptide (TPR) repeat protein
VTAQPPPFDLQATLAHDGPLPRDAALAALDHASQLMSTADFVDAARLYQRVIGYDDPAITGAALVGLGEAWHRLDDDAQALATWEEATRLPDSAATYPAWRNVAAARVRKGDLRGAIDAYREAEARPGSRPPRSRRGWPSKEVGDQGARAVFRARPGRPGLFAIALVAATTIVSPS